MSPLARVYPSHSRDIANTTMKTGGAQNVGKSSADELEQKREKRVKAATGKLSGFKGVRGLM